MRGSAGHRACKEEGGARIEGGPQCSHHSYPMAPSSAAFTLAAVWMCTLGCARAAGKVQVKMQAIICSSIDARFSLPATGHRQTLRSLTCMHETVAARIWI